MNRALVLPLLVLTLSARAQSVLRYWSGALAPTGITVNVQLSAPTDSLRVLVSDDPGFWNTIASPMTATDSSTWCMVPVRVDSLLPGTAYRYRFEVNGIPDTTTANTGWFRTPSTGATNFRFVVGSCNESSAHPVWQAMQAMDPLFLLSTGDLHYADPFDTAIAAHRMPYTVQVLGTEPAATFFRHVPIAYTWDDHDFCGDGSNSTTLARFAAFKSYREFVPHYPLAQPNDTAPIHQAFTIGRLRFLLSDMRGTKTPTQMMDSAQHAWLRHELVQAKNKGWLCVWVTSLSWNAIGYPENWGSAPGERAALADFLRDHDIRDLLIICGDAHMLAIDSGTNGDFSTGANNPWNYPVFQAAAINRAGSYKGGTYDQGGWFPNPDQAHGQFGSVNVIDDGSQICITLEGWRTDSMAYTLSLVNSYTFCRSPVAQGTASREPGREGLSAAWCNNAWTLTWPGAQGSGQVTVLDTLGRAVWQRDVDWVDDRCTVAGGPLPQGAYVIRVINGDKATQVKTGNR